MLDLAPTFAPIVATLQQGRKALREQLQQMDERGAINWASLEGFLESSSEFGDQAEALLVLMMAQGADEAEIAAAQELVLFFTHSSVHMMMRLRVA